MGFGGTPLPQPLAPTDSPTFAAVVTSKIYPPADAIAALSFFKADGLTKVITLDTINIRIGLGGVAPTQRLDIGTGRFICDNNYGYTQRSSGGATVTVVNLSSSDNLTFGQTTTINDAYFNVGGVANALVVKNTSGNVGIGAPAPGVKLEVGGKFKASQAILPGLFTVATAPAGVNGEDLFFTDGRKLLEGAGLGTGVKGTYSNGAWRRPSDDSVVVA